MMKKLLKKIIPLHWRIKMRQCLLYVQAYYFRACYSSCNQCTVDSLRCESDKRSKNYRYDVLGGDIPVCCASHLVELLFWIDKVLRKNGFSYHINYGTLLGAVRHQGGIIPWDTDVDVSIDKKDMLDIYKVLTCQAEESSAPYCVKVEQTEVYGDVIKVYFSNVNTLHVDLFCYTLTDGDILDYCDFKVSKNDVFPLREIPFYGRKVYIPNTLAPLDVYYGSDWNKYYYAQWGLFTRKKTLTEGKRKPAKIDYSLIHEY